MIKTTLESIIDRAFIGLEIMLGCKKEKTSKKNVVGGKKCKNRKYQTSGFVPNPKKEDKQ